MQEETTMSSNYGLIYYVNIISRSFATVSFITTPSHAASRKLRNTLKERSQSII